MGDAVLAIFGVPRAHDDDPERAVRAALRDAGRAVGAEPRVRARGHAELQMRIGVEAGEVLVDMDRASGPRDRMLTGDAVNVAARLQSAAEPGRVIVGPGVYAATKDVIEYRELPALDLKGKADPVPAWQVLRDQGAAARRTPAARDAGGARRSRRGARRAQADVPARPGRGPAGARHRDRPRRGGEVPALARARGHVEALPDFVVLAPRPMPGLRERRRTRRSPMRSRPSARSSRTIRPTSRSRRSRRPSSSCSATTRWCRRSPRWSARATRGRSRGRSSSTRGAGSSSGWPRATRSCFCSRTSTGPMPACWTSSTTSRTGRRARSDRGARASRAVRRAPVLGRREAQRRGDLPRSVVGRRERSDARGSALDRGRRRARRRDRRPERGQSAVRRGDRAQADRRRGAARSRGRPVGDRTAGHRRRGPSFDPRADRGAARRAAERREGVPAGGRRGGSGLLGRRGGNADGL